MEIEYIDAGNTYKRKWLQTMPMGLERERKGAGDWPFSQTETLHSTKHTLDKKHTHTGTLVQYGIHIQWTHSRLLLDKSTNVLYILDRNTTQ